MLVSSCLMTLFAFSREFLSVWTFSYRSVPHNSHLRWLLLLCVLINPLITYTQFVFFLLCLLLMLHETGNYFHPAFVPLLCYTLWDDGEVWWGDGNDKVLRICKRRLNFEYFGRYFYSEVSTPLFPPFMFFYRFSLREGFVHKRRQTVFNFFKFLPNKHAKTDFFNSRPPSPTILYLKTSFMIEPKVNFKT